MFKLENKIKNKKYGIEISIIKEEINRSKRFDYFFSVLAVEVSHSVPRGLSRVMPGKVISFHLMEKFLRGYDKMLGPFWRRYFIILPQTGREGADSVKQRINKLARKHNWGVVSIGMAVYPEDCKSSIALLDKAISNISKS